MSVIMESRSFEREVILSLKNLRQRKKITQTELGERIGVSRDTIARIESGRHRIYLAQVVAIARELDVTLQDLFRGEDPGIVVDETMNSTRQDVKIVYLSAEENSQQPAGSYTKKSEQSVNPYLREYAVERYSTAMEEFILQHSSLWWWVPKDKLSGLSIASVVEAVLNYGKENDVVELLQMIGVDKAADVFKHGISGFRTNYRADTISYFNAYFKRHVPGYSN